MKRIILFLFLFPLILNAQNQTGIIPFYSNDKTVRDSIRAEARRRADSAYMAMYSMVVNGLAVKQDVSSAFTQSTADGRYSLLSHTQPWTSITTKPTTIAGYGITDAFNQEIADARYSILGHSHAWSAITSKPTTLSGYGITDAFTQSAADARYPSLASLVSRDSIMNLNSALRLSLDSVKTKVLFTQTASQTVSATIAKTTILGTGVGSTTVPASQIIPGKTYRVRIEGIYSTPPLLNLGTFTCRMEINGTVVTSSSTLTLLASASNSAFSAEQIITFRTVGNSGTVVATGCLSFNSALNTRSYVDMNTGTGTVTINTTSGVTFTPTVQWGSTNASHSVTSLIATLEALN